MLRSILSKDALFLLTAGRIVRKAALINARFHFLVVDCASIKISINSISISTNNGGGCSSPAAARRRGTGEGNEEHALRVYGSLSLSLSLSLCASTHKPIAWRHRSQVQLPNLDLFRASAIQCYILSLFSAGHRLHQSDVKQSQES